MCRCLLYISKGHIVILCYALLYFYVQNLLSLLIIGKNILWNYCMQMASSLHVRESSAKIHTWWLPQFFFLFCVFFFFFFGKNYVYYCGAVEFVTLTHFTLGPKARAEESIAKDIHESPNCLKTQPRRIPSSASRSTLKEKTSSV